MQQKNGAVDISMFPDHFVVYRSTEEEDERRYVAHSIRTDQVGMGDDMEEAIVDLFAALRTLFAEAERDPRVVVAQKAPEEVVDRFLESPRLPDEIWSRVFSRLRGIRHEEEGYWQPDVEDDEEEVAAQELEEAATVDEPLGRNFTRSDLELVEA